MRVNKDTLFDYLSSWNDVLERKTRLVACGGTAMTLIGVKDSTKDIDLMVPDHGEYESLIRVLEKIGYRQVTGHGWEKDEGLVFDLFSGNKIHTTELLHSPLDEGRNIPLREYTKISIGILNYYDLISSKLFRGNSVDYSDCMILYQAKKDEIDLKNLEAHFREMASYDVSEDKVNKNFQAFKHRIISLEKGKGGHGFER